MKSRLAMMAMLTSGLLMSGTGATLAVSGSSDDAARSQYTPTQQVAPPAAPRSENAPAPASGDVLPQESEGGTAPQTGRTPATPDSPSGSAPDSAPDSADEAPAVREQGAAPADAQPVAQQAASGEDELPFTGFAAIPILAGGIALMGGGLVMRRRTVA